MVYNPLIRTIDIVKGPMIMQTLPKRGLFEPGRITYLPVYEIRTTQSPRHRFEEIRQLADSVARYGVLQPLSVRRERAGYSLISGERRLRAAKLVGLCEVPCVVLEADSRECRILALVENLQRRELDFVEQAEGLYTLVADYGMSQEEAARRVGLSQSAAANKLRLLKLPRELLEKMRDAGLSERHARAMLRLTDHEDQRRVLAEILLRSMTVCQAEEYIDEYLSLKQQQRAPEYYIRDVRPFINTVAAGVRRLCESGMPSVMTRTDTDRYTILTVKIKKPNPEEKC